MKKFKIPHPVMPTLEEHRRASAQWLMSISPCLYENWSQALRDQSFPTKMIGLGLDDQARLIDAFDGGPTIGGDLVDRINAAAYPGGFLPKLSSRSAKDAWVNTFKCLTGDEVLNQFASSERILADLIEYEYADTFCYLLIRQWFDIPKHEEWRCFIRDGTIIGISQYFYTDDFSRFYADKAGIHSRLLVYLRDVVIPLLHVGTVVIDVWLKESPMIIEINPYGLSDPCLLSYPELESGDCGIRTFGGIP